MACEMCDSANGIEAGENSFAIARLTTGYVTLCATQYFRGYTIFAARRCVREIYDLPAWANRALTGLLAAERAALRWIDLPIGVSLLCLARKA